VGTLLKQKWRLDSLLGVGGVAAVYAGTHRTGYSVAVKILHTELSIVEEVLSRFAREPYVANRIKHPGVVRVLDDDVTEDGTTFIVMDLLEGETLDDLRRRRGGRLPLAEALSIADRLLDVLAAAHSIGIVHRDIKPQNVFITSDGALKLLDFGIARVAEGSSTLTQAGGMMGTPAFMSPEQARGRWQTVDARSDLWSVGATLFVLLSGHFVHEAETMIELHIAAATTPARSIVEVVPELPADVERLIGRALAYDQIDRWADAQAMRLAVCEVMGDKTEFQPSESSLPDFGALSVGPSGTVILSGVAPALPRMTAPGSSATATSGEFLTIATDSPVTLDLLTNWANAERELQDLWYVGDGTNAIGPVTLDLLVRGVEARKVPDGCVVRHASWSEWRLLRTASEASVDVATDSAEEQVLLRSNLSDFESDLALEQASLGRLSSEVPAGLSRTEPVRQDPDEESKPGPDDCSEDAVTSRIEPTDSAEPSLPNPITVHAVSRQIHSVSSGKRPGVTRGAVIALACCATAVLVTLAVGRPGRPGASSGDSPGLMVSAAPVTPSGSVSVTTEMPTSQVVAAVSASASASVSVSAAPLETAPPGTTIVPPGPVSAAPKKILDPYDSDPTDPYDEAEAERSRHPPEQGPSKVPLPGTSGVFKEKAKPLPPSDDPYN
jgi:serine/threonine-protein kinase